MVLHRLVQIHTLQNWRIETGKKLIADNNDFKRIFRITEPVQNLGLFITGSDICFVFICLVIIRIHDNCRSLRSEQLIQFGLVLDAARTIQNNDLCFISIRMHFSHEMLCDMRTDFVNTLLVIDDSLHIDMLGKFSFFIFVQAVSEHVKFPVHRIFVYMQINWHRFKFKWKRGMIADRI